MSERLHSSVQTLLQDITVPTEERATQAPAAATTAPAIEHTTTTPAEPAPVAQPAAPVAEPKPELTQEALESTSELVIGMFDFSQHNLFRALANRKKKNKLTRLYGEDATDKLEKALNKVETVNANTQTATIIEAWTADEIGMLRFHKAAEEYLEGLPLTDYEKEALKKPLIELLKKKGGTIPPEIALLLAVLQISGARATELFMM